VSNGVNNSNTIMKCA